ncbi:MAG: hypothetical protein ABUK01_00260 [Leptospirales bacterium]
MSKIEKYEIVSRYTRIPIQKLKEMLKEDFNLIVRALRKTGVMID